MIYEETWWMHRRRFKTDNGKLYISTKELDLEIPLNAIRSDYGRIVHKKKLNVVPLLLVVVGPIFLAWYIPFWIDNKRDVKLFIGIMLLTFGTIPVLFGIGYIFHYMRPSRVYYTFKTDTSPELFDIGARLDNEPELKAFADNILNGGKLL